MRSDKKRRWMALRQGESACVESVRSYQNGFLDPGPRVEAETSWHIEMQHHWCTGIAESRLGEEKASPRTGGEDWISRADLEPG